MPITDNNMRIDKWLWCARFFKTRNLASAAVNSGKVTINGEKIKPSKNVQAGTNLNIRSGVFNHDITITSLANNRKSAKEAALLFIESKESIQKRETLKLQMNLDAKQFPRSKGRPSKRDRRQLMKFKTNQSIDD